MAIAPYVEPITVCTYGFNVPCRRFLISANVTRDRRLPVVDEFVLRTLKLCESVPVKRLGAYFGFSNSETDAVVGDLVNRGFVIVDGDSASLHPSAQQMFRGADDGMPRVQEIDPWVDRLWFAVPERFGSVVLKGREELIFDPQPHLRPHLLEVEVENILRYRPLTTALTDAYRLLTGPDPSAAGLAEFTRMVTNTTVTDAHNPDGLFDLSNWLSANLSMAGSERHTLIGASYLQRNIEFFAPLLERRAAASSGTSVPREIQILWYRPGGSGWGTSPDLQEALTALKAILRRAMPKIAVRTALVIPQVAKRDNPRRFERVFDEAYVTPAGHMSPSIEVLLVGDIGAIVLVRVMLSQAVSAFVGYALADSVAVERIRRNLSWDTIVSRSEELWSRPRIREEDDLPPEVLLETDPDEN